MQTDPISAATAYRQALEQIQAARSLHDAVQRAAAVLKAVTFIRPSAEEQIVVSSGFGGNTQRPYVTLTTTNPMIQMGVSTARQIALQILEAAEAATSDGVIIQFGKDQMDLDERAAGQLLSVFRAFREKASEQEE